MKLFVLLVAVLAAGCQNESVKVPTVDADSKTIGVPVGPQIASAPPGSPRRPPPPEPIPFPEMTTERKAAIRAALRTQLGAPVSIEGPYSPELLEWVSTKGTNAVATSQWDLSPYFLAEVLRARPAKSDIFYYFFFDEHGFAEVGYAFVDGVTIAGFYRIRSSWYAPKQPNQALEPTPGSVTPRAPQSSPK